MTVYKPKSNPGKWTFFIFLFAVLPVFNGVILFSVMRESGLVIELRWLIISVGCILGVALVSVWMTRLRYKVEESILSLSFGPLFRRRVCLREVIKIEEGTMVAPRPIVADFGDAVFWRFRMWLPSALGLVIGKRYLFENNEEIYCFCSSRYDVTVLRTKGGLIGVTPKDKEKFIKDLKAAIEKARQTER